MSFIHRFRKRRTSQRERQQAKEIAELTEQLQIEQSQVRVYKKMVIQHQTALEFMQKRWEMATAKLGVDLEAIGVDPESYQE